MKTKNYSLFNPANFYAFYECDDDDKKTLLEFQLFLHSSDIYNEILNHEKFSPSKTWLSWLSETFIGFSSDQMLIKSGHRMYESYDPFFFKVHKEESQYSFIRLIYIIIRRLLFRDIVSKKRQMSEFTKSYKNITFDDVQVKIFNMNPGAYMRALEVHELTKNNRNNTIMEIGAGACLNLALHHHLYNANSIIVDLPETIMVGYTTLKCLFPESSIILPHQVEKQLKSGKNFNSIIKDNDFVFLLPTQIDYLEDLSLDKVFNMASFQEMDIEVVNNYLDVVYKKLDKDGSLIFLNMEVSRQVKGNSISNYDINNYRDKTFITPPHANFEIKSLKSLKYIFFEGIK